MPAFQTVPNVATADVLESLSGSTLLLPTVSIGNIPQLAIDLFIYNLPGTKLVCRLDPTLLYPFVAPADYATVPDGEVRPSGKESAATALEVYYCEKYNVTLLQQRSPVLPGYTQQFIESVLRPFVESSAFDKVVVLQSNDQGLKEDKYDGKRFQLWTSDVTESFATGLSIQEKRVLAPVEVCSEVSETAAYLFKRVAGDAVRPTSKPDEAALAIFAYEGDNAGDAKAMFDATTKLLGLKDSEVQVELVPKSWEGVYGSQPRAADVEGLYT